MLETFCQGLSTSNTNVVSCEAVYEQLDPTCNKLNTHVLYFFGGGGGGRGRVDMMRQYYDQTLSLGACPYFTENFVI